MGKLSIKVTLLLDSGRISQIKACQWPLLRCLELIIILVIPDILDLMTGNLDREADLQGDNNDE